MLKSLLIPFRTAFLGLLAASLLFSCDSSDDETDVHPVAGPLETQYNLVDSVKVHATYQSSYPELFNKFNDKIYAVSSQNQMEASYHLEGRDIVLSFLEKSNEKRNSWITLTIKNRTLAQLPATFSLNKPEEVCLKEGQDFEDGSSVLSFDCTPVLDGTATLQYDPTTKVLSGSITGLKFIIDFYVPNYSFPNTSVSTYLRSSGSNRNLNFSFKNVPPMKE